MYHIKKHPYVRIEPNFELLCRQYLRDTEDTNGAIGNHGDDGGDDDNRPRKVPMRRNTITGINLYNVDGEVTEYGQEFFQRPIGSRTETVINNDQNMRRFLRIGRLQGSDTGHAGHAGKMNIHFILMALMFEIHKVKNFAGMLFFIVLVFYN